MEITECKGIQTLQYRHLFLQGKRKMNVLMLLASRDIDFSMILSAYDDNFLL